MTANTSEVFGASPEVEALQDSTRRLTQFVDSCPQLDGALLTNVQLTTGQVNEIAHPLNRPVKGFIIVDKTTLSFITRSTVRNDDPNNTLRLICTVNAVVSIWVF